MWCSIHRASSLQRGEPYASVPTHVSGSIRVHLRVGDPFVLDHGYCAACGGPDLQGLPRLWRLPCVWGRWLVLGGGQALHKIISPIRGFKFVNYNYRMDPESGEMKRGPQTAATGPFLKNHLASSRPFVWGQKAYQQSPRIYMFLKNESSRHSSRHRFGPMIYMFYLLHANS